MSQRMKTWAWVALAAIAVAACDRKHAAPQDLESGKAPTGTIERAEDRVDRVKADEATQPAPGPGGSGGGSNTGAAAAGGSPAGGGRGPSR